MIKNREDLIQEAIDRKSAELDGSPNLRKWKDEQILFFKTHPNYNNELDNISSLFPKNIDEFNTNIEYETSILKNKVDLLNELLNSNFKNEEKIACIYSFERYDGMPIGTFTISSKNRDYKISLDTFNNKEKIDKLFKYFVTSNIDKGKYCIFLSEGYALKRFNSYSQSYSYYKYTDNGCNISFMSYSSIEELANSFRYF